MSKDKNNDNIKSKEAPTIMKIAFIGGMLAAMLLGHHMLFKDNQTPEPHQKANQSQQLTR